MKITALCKTYSCDEFIEAAIESIYDFVDHIVFVNSDIDWTGKSGINKVKSTILQWQKQNDKQKKIIHIDANVSNQWKQCNIGYQWIKDNLKPDWIMIFDTDEVWDFENIAIAKNILVKSTEYNAISAQMHTYIKSPFYRVSPPEWCKPTVFIRPIHIAMQGTRGNKVSPRLFCDELFFHHFTYVRMNEKDVFRKIQTTLRGDRDDAPNVKLTNIKQWKKEKWDQLPRAYNFHTTKCYEKSWHRIKQISISDLPQTLRNKAIVEKFM